MNERQENLLSKIIEDYIRTVIPVASDYLVKKYKLKVSGATVRNDCQYLEKRGFLTHPHISAGRVPTEKGYRYYVLRSQNKGIVLEDTRYLDVVYNQVGGLGTRDKVKYVAKAVAELVDGAVIVGFAKSDSYYTGLSYLFSQPEFKNHDLVYNITAVVDHLDEVIASVYDEMSDDVIVKIGSENPFGVDCSFVGVRHKDGLFGLLGPMRMDYMSNISRVKYTKSLLFE